MRFGSPPPRTFEVTPTDEEVAFFQENGYLVVERLTTDEELAWMSDIFDAVIDEPSAATFEPGRPDGDDGPPQLLQSMFPEMRFPELLDTTYRANALGYASALLGVPADALSSWGHMIRKPPHTNRAAPWHQDEAYWEPELDYLAIGAWLPLHDVTVEMGCMQFVPGSHRGALLDHVHDVTGAKTNLLHAVDVDASNAVACPLPAGGATFHHPRTLHYTAPNTTDTPRRAFPMEFQLAPVRRSSPARRPWVEELREATGRGEPTFYVADGKMVPVGA